MKEAQYSKPASQVDLEARQAEDYVPSSVVLQGKDPELSKNGYVGVDPIYQNAANEVDLPVQADEGPEAKVFEEHLAEDVEYPTEAGEVKSNEELAEEEDDDEEEEEEEEEPAPSYPTPSSPSSPPQV